jgi:citrate lyase subunit beta/citryl-CoA lyase
MRSKLFVPGARRELFAKALATQADAISFDVEDSVVHDAKGAARQEVARFLRSESVSDSNKIIIVRVNAPGSQHFEGDLMAFACPQVAFLNLPKIESAADVHGAVAALEVAEARNGVSQPIRLLLNIESARGLRQAPEIASAHPRVSGLQLGLADMFEALGIEREDPRNRHAALFAMRMAAAETGAFAYDSAYPNVQDDEGFRAEALEARRLGYLGKSCIHPRQIAIANEIFRKDELDLAQARRIVAAAKSAAANGRGAFLLDGRMIDLPYLRRAEALLAEAHDADRSS